MKDNHPHIHISWTFRDQANQHQAFLNGTSKLEWPNSPHNAKDLLGNPSSDAIDLFILDDDGRARWSVDVFRFINEQVKLQGLPLKWGGDFKSIGDFDHWQIC